MVCSEVTDCDFLSDMAWSAYGDLSEIVFASRFLNVCPSGGFNVNKNVRPSDRRDWLLAADCHGDLHVL